MGLSNRFIIEDEIGTKYYPHTFAEITFLDDGTSVESAIGDIRNSINGLNTNLGSIQLTWDSVTGKPTTFTPATHTHTVAQVTGISYPVTSVAGKTGVVALAKADVALGNVENYGIATTAQAQAGASNGVYMTPLRVVETINAKASGLTVSKATYDSGGLNINTEITSLKSTVASGKTSVANAINGKTGLTLTNQNTFADMAYYINSIPDIKTSGVIYQGGSRPKNIQITDCRVLVGSCNGASGFSISCSGGPTSVKTKVVRVDWNSSTSFDNNDTVYSYDATFDLSSKIAVSDQRVFAIIFSQPVTFTITGNNTYESVMKIL